MGNLYVVATPIGNMQDITFRAVKILFEVDFILAENSSKTSQFLTGLIQMFPNLTSNSKPELIVFNEYEEINKIPKVIALLEQGKNIALVSSAGTPLISDPGFKLVREAYKRRIKVISIPGPSSIIAALSSSPLPTDKFLFLGFLPRSSSKMKTSLRSLNEVLRVMQDKKMIPTVVIFESPHRLKFLLNELLDTIGDINIVLGKELTKIYENIELEKVSIFVDRFKSAKPKGEYIVLFNLKEQDSLLQD
ncbi:16S rRNA (cytidine(1402)-2'-O)-methyltransferase [Candidatus Parcubacteria bacterium]|nr:MAG: 16S rRNA (cytidine(1402)-2'-O)-methyltransferase [Candidatus Parcubacteria bacterium]